MIKNFIGILPFGGLRGATVVIAVMMAYSVQMMMADDKYSRYYEDLPVPIAKVTYFTVPEYRVSIVDFGAVGDGMTLCTKAIQDAIDEVAQKGGGHVDVPAGVWLTAPIELKDNIDLHLDKNAILYMTPDKRLHVGPHGQKRCMPGISAVGCRNISITGEGIIDGNGAQWRPVKRSKVSDVEWNVFKRTGGVEKDNGALWYPWKMKNGMPDIASSPERQELMRNDIIRLENCENIIIQGVTVQNSPRFHVHPCNCRNVIIDGVTVRCPWNAQNGDAIDLSDCNQCLVVNCTVDAGDDGLCMKSGDTKKNVVANGCYDILIQECTVYHAHGGFVIGSEDVTAMRDIVVRRCRFAGTDTGLRFKSGIGRGGKTERIYISDIVMSDIKDEAVVIQCDYVNLPAGVKKADAQSYVEALKKKGEKVPEFQDINITNVVCRGCKTAVKASGISGMNAVHDINISKSVFLYTEKGKDIDESTAIVNMKEVILKDDISE